jgi:hypothetical protein
MTTAQLPLYGSPEDIRAAILADLRENAEAGFWARIPEAVSRRLDIPLPTLLAELLVLECAGTVRRWAGSAYEIVKEVQQP